METALATVGFSPLLVCHESKKGLFFEWGIEDGRRPTAYAVQTEYTNHLKVL